MTSSRNAYLDHAFVKENPAIFLMTDADFALQCAKDARYCGNGESSSRFARMAILLYAVSLEAFINFVYEYSEVPRREWESLSLKDKWLRASKVCLPLHGIVHDEDGIVYQPGDPIETFAENENPFVLFIDLKDFRDRVVHLKPTFTSVLHREVDSHLLRNEFYVTSGLPKRLKMCVVEHAEIAMRISEQMIAELDRQMKGLVLPLFQGEAWVETITEVSGGWESDTSDAIGSNLDNEGNQR